MGFLMQLTTRSIKKMRPKNIFFDIIHNYVSIAIPPRHASSCSPPNNRRGVVVIMYVPPLSHPLSADSEPLLY
jgi:hypothetical protein